MGEPSWRRVAFACVPAVVLPVAAHAQAMATAGSPPVGVSQEQFLSLMGRLEALERRNSELEAEIRQVKAQAEAAGPPKPEPTAAQATLANGRPTLATADKEFSASLRGVVQIDAARYDQAGAGPLSSDFRRGSFGDAAEADRARDLADGVNFRRVRFGVEGRLWGDWAYNILTDVGGSGTEESGRIINAYLDYTGFDPIKLRAGAFAAVTSFDDATSSSSLLFLERPAVVEIVRGLAGSDGRAGLAAMSNGERWSLFTAVTGNLVGTSTFDDQLGLIGRASYLPLKTDDGLLHVGASANVVVRPAATGPDVGPDGAPTPLRIRERPELRVDGTRLIDTGSINSSGLSVYGLEFGAQHRALSVQAEYFWFDLQRRASTLPDPNFDGWYVQGAWTITGEPRRYVAANGGFDTPRVVNPFDLDGRSWGVWELAARWSDMDFNYRAGSVGTAPVLGAIRGGRQQILSLGLNWYPNNNVRFLADYQRVEVDRLSPGGTAFGAGDLTPPAGAQIGQELNIWSLRTQYAF
jgi:phosphate-selective porin OprO/OprP